MTKDELLATIQKAKTEQWRNLDLSNQDITELPPEIGQLTALQSLGLRGNQLKQLPSEIEQLTVLKSLYLGWNQLTQLPSEIGQLVALQSLDLRHNQLTQLPSEIGQLTALQSLDLIGNQFNQLPSEIGQLMALQALDLSYNKFSQLPHEIGQLVDLRSLNLRHNRLKYLPPEIGQLTTLQSLNLNQSFYLGENQINKLPPEIERLTNLKFLDLRGNGLKKLPFEIELLKNLIVLDVRYNPAYLPEIIGKLKKQGDGIYIPQNNPNIPEEFLVTNSFDIYNYLISDNRKPLPLNEAKLILVGEGAVGKTCLVNRLLHDKFEIPKKTEGIDRHSWKGLDINGHKVHLNVWDFGGQEVLHATHQFFLTKRSVYILVLDARRGEQESRLEYWLKLIQSFGSDSPILIAINKSDEEHRLTLNQRFLKEKYPSIKEFCPISCVTGQGITELKQGIKNTVSVLPHIHDLMPASWFELKQSLEENKDNYISYDDYKNLCIKHDITEQGSQSTLCGFLNDLGIVLNFSDDDRFDRLRETNVLNPEWVTNAVYKLLNNLELFKSHGVFTVTDLARMLDSSAYPSSKEHQFIIDMMRKFELCFSITDTKNYLIPELLQNEEPDLNWNKVDSLRFEYHYDILPHSVFSRFIVRLHEYISKQTYWRTGVVLTHENNKALIKADIEDRKIFVWVNGNNKTTRRVLLGIIRQNFDHIHKTIKGLEAKECISLPQKNNVVIEYKHLLKLEEKGITEYYYPAIDEDINVQDLLNGIEKPEFRQQQKLSSTIMDNKKSTPLETKPVQKTILIAAASPSDEARLRLDVEVRDIAEGLRLAEQRDQFLLEKIWATRVRDLRRAMQNHKPTIVHFCGHGTGEQGIILEDNQGKAQLVSSDALAGFFELFTDSVECVVLNACFSVVQAEGIVNHIPYVIGMNKAIGDEAAIEFSVAFYDSLAAGEHYERAYKIACSAIAMAGISGHLIPQLFKKTG